jgi:hypothetical protein
VKESGSILLQTIPDTINIESLRSELLTAFPDIINVHDLHVWILTGTKVFSTAHIIFLNSRVSSSSCKHHSLQHIWCGHRLPKSYLFLHYNIFHKRSHLQSSMLGTLYSKLIKPPLKAICKMHCLKLSQNILLFCLHHGDTVSPSMQCYLEILEIKEITWNNIFFIMRNSHTDKAD